MTIKIVPATEELLAEVEVWLDAEEAKYQITNQAWEDGGCEGDQPRRGFRCNWDTVKKGWLEYEQKVDVLVLDEAAIGFLAGTDILEIHPAHRGRGYGVLLADFMIKRAFDEGYSVVEIEIAPRAAEAFWVRQGFIPDQKRLRGGNGLYAHLELPRSFSLGDGPRVRVEIAFYDEQARYKGGRPFKTFDGEGERLPDGTIQLPERVHGTDNTLDSNVENHVRIVVDGDEVFFDRAKYGRVHGTARDPKGNHYIDRICAGV